MPVVSPPNADLIADLATTAHETPVLSAHLRTDPRDPANTRHQPAWHIALRNGLRELQSSLGESGNRDDRLALRELAERLDEELPALPAEERARSLSVFISGDGQLDLRMPSQLPIRDDVVRWDRHPFISPLVDIVDRGRPTGIVLVDGDEVRLLHWEGGVITEPENSHYVMETGDWSRRETYAHANPGRGGQTVGHVDGFVNRLEDHRRRFLGGAAEDVARRLDDLGWERLLVAAAPKTGDPFVEALPIPTRARIAAEVEAQLTPLDAASVADHLEPVLDSAWEVEALSVMRDAVDRAGAGGAGALGTAEVADALVAGQVAHLVYDPSIILDAEALSPPAFAAFDEPPSDLVVERAVERAVETDALVSALRDSDELDAAGGIVATLRY
ncbi:MAG: host attachment protein [Solirubrobacteraceae bacterium]|nr:host attachment protein [Solirubrobacteraceae bacterium]